MYNDIRSPMWTYTRYTHYLYACIVTHAQIDVDCSTPAYNMYIKRFIYGIYFSRRSFDENILDGRYALPLMSLSGVYYLHILRGISYTRIRVYTYATDLYNVYCSTHVHNIECIMYII